VLYAILDADGRAGMDYNEFVALMMPPDMQVGARPALPSPGARVPARARRARRPCALREPLNPAHRAPRAPQDSFGQTHTVGTSTRISRSRAGMQACPPPPPFPVLTGQVLSLPSY